MNTRSNFHFLINRLKNFNFIEDIIGGGENTTDTETTLTSINSVPDITVSQTSVDYTETNVNSEQDINTETSINSVPDITVSDTSYISKYSSKYNTETSLNTIPEMTISETSYSANNITSDNSVSNVTLSETSFNSKLNIPLYTESANEETENNNDNQEFIETYNNVLNNESSIDSFNNLTRLGDTETSVDSFNLSQLGNTESEVNYNSKYLMKQDNDEEDFPIIKVKHFINEIENNKNDLNTHTEIDDILYSDEPEEIETKKIRSIYNQSNEEFNINDLTKLI